MASSTPIRNGKLQTELDFNDQTISNATNAKKLAVATSGTAATYTIQTSDMFKLIPWAYSGTADFYAPAATASIPYGSEVIFYNSLGGIRVSATGAATVVAAQDITSPGNTANTTSGSYATGCLIYVSSNTWLLTGNLIYS
jgi:hypothetical protein